MICFWQKECDKIDVMWLLRVFFLDSYCDSPSPFLFSSPPLSPSLLLTACSGGSQTPCDESTQATCGKVHIERKWDLLPTTSTNLAGIWLSHLESRSSGPSQAFEWPQIVTQQTSFLFQLYWGKTDKKCIYIFKIYNIMFWYTYTLWKMSADILTTS